VSPINATIPVTSSGMLPGFGVTEVPFGVKVTTGGPPVSVKNVLVVPLPSGLMFTIPTKPFGSDVRSEMEPVLSHSPTPKVLPEVEMPSGVKTAGPDRTSSNSLVLPSINAGKSSTAWTLSNLGYFEGVPLRILGA